MREQHNQKWRLDRQHGKLAGVCAGFARHYDHSVGLIRLMAIVLFICFPLAMLVAYGLAAMILPNY